MPDIKSLSLPKKFKAWRDGQEEVVQAIHDGLQEHKVFLLDAPTGTGKSIIAMAVNNMFACEDQVMQRLAGEHVDKPRCIYVTRTKQLQSQLLHDFPAARGIWGRANYPCARLPNKFPEITAEDCHKDSCLVTEACLYRRAKQVAIKAPISVLNASYFLTEANGVGQFSGAQLLVLDEVDSLEADLMNHIQIEFSSKQLTRLKLPLCQDSWGWLSWQSWASLLNRQVILQKGEVERQLPMDDKFGSTDIKNLKRTNELDRLSKKLHQLCRIDPHQWVSFTKVDEIGNKIWTFKPILVSEYNNLFLRHANRVLGMSGTILNANILADNLGMRNYVSLRLDSPFPKENRPIYYAPVANLTQKTMSVEMPKLLKGIEHILKLHPEEKILVHTTSYAIRDYLQYTLDLSRVITHDAADRNEKLEQFKSSTKPLVMLSPSFDRGVDLPDDLCRVIVICKVPYPDLGDKQIRTRLEVPGGELWYQMHTVQTILQMSGRGVRSKEDHCAIYILDQQFGKVYQRARNFFPEWWTAAFQSSIPGWR